ncbi:MAG: isoprenylcysteine carboxylmethyltransferase family protein [Bdellovibrionales bacterium]
MTSDVSAHPILFTVLWLVFSALWGARSVVARKQRRYAKGKALVDTNRRYKVVSHLVYGCQTVVVIPLFWSSSPLWLKVHESDLLRGVGFAMIYGGLFLSIYALVHLKENYSPCYDSHLPHRLVTSGPYRFVRHPGWTSKVLVGLGSLFMTGSVWFVPLLAWLIIEMRRTIQIEERALLSALSGYREYKAETSALIPRISFTRGSVRG